MHQETLEVSEVINIINQNVEFFSPIIGSVFSCWSALFVGQGGIPDRRTILPNVVPETLSNIWLCDYEAEDDRYRYRFAGAQIVSGNDVPMHGRYLDEIVDVQSYQRVSAYFQKCIKMPAAVHMLGRLYAEQSRIAVGERVMLPYRDNDGQSVGILGTTVLQWHDESSAEPIRPSDESRRHTYYWLGDGTREIVDFRFS